MTILSSFTLTYKSETFKYSEVHIVIMYITFNRAWKTRLKKAGIEVIEDDELPSVIKYSVSSMITTALVVYMGIITALYPGLILSYIGALIVIFRFPKRRRGK